MSALLLVRTLSSSSLSSRLLSSQTGGIHSSSYRLSLFNNVDMASNMRYRLSIGCMYRHFSSPAPQPSSVISNSTQHDRGNTPHTNSNDIAASLYHADSSNVTSSSSDNNVSRDESISSISSPG